MAAATSFRMLSIPTCVSRQGLYLLKGNKHVSNLSSLADPFKCGLGRRSLITIGDISVSARLKIRYVTCSLKGQGDEAYDDIT